MKPEKIPSSKGPKHGDASWVEESLTNKEIIIPLLCFMPGSLAISTVLITRYMLGRVSGLDPIVASVAIAFILSGVVGYVREDLWPTRCRRDEP
jgi:hypothetical protein